MKVDDAAEESLASPVPSGVESQNSGEKTCLLRTCLRPPPQLSSERQCDLVTVGQQPPQKTRTSLLFLFAGLFHEKW